MKKTLIILFLITPLICFGQENVSIQTTDTTSSEQMDEKQFLGCYELTVTSLKPEIKLGADTWFTAEHPKIILDSNHIVRPISGIPTNLSSHSYWKLQGKDSIIIVLSNGFSGLQMGLRPSGDILKGQSVTFWDFPAEIQQSEVVAQKTSCEFSPTDPREAVKKAIDKLKHHRVEPAIASSLPFATESTYIDVSQLSEDEQQLYFSSYVSGFLDGLNGRDFKILPSESSSKVEDFFEACKKMTVAELSKEMLKFYQKNPEFRLRTPASILLTVIPRLKKGLSPWPTLVVDEKGKPKLDEKGNIITK